MRQLGLADVEFYHANLVLEIAKSYPGKPYDQLLYRARQRRLDQAVIVASRIVNDSAIVSSISIRARQLS